jgi:hypothetical protein
MKSPLDDIPREKRIIIGVVVATLVLLFVLLQLFKG